MQRLRRDYAGAMQRLYSGCELAVQGLCRGRTNKVIEKVYIYIYIYNMQKLHEDTYTYNLYDSTSCVLYTCSQSRPKLLFY